MNKKTQKKRRAHRFGIRAEEYCAWWLRAKGYRIIGERWRHPLGEVDIIAQRGRVLCFVEVKARASEAEALEAVTADKRQRIARAAAAFIASASQWQGLDVRFDVMTCAPRRWPRHIENAWSL